MQLTRCEPAADFDPEKRITNFQILGKKDKATNRRQYTDDGLFSKKIFGDIDVPDSIYTCGCDKPLVGKFYEGQVCPHCGQKVVYMGKNVEITGWIDLSGNEYDDDGNVSKPGKGYKILEYIQYLFLERIIGSENLRNIWQTPGIIDENGDFDGEEIEKVRTSKPCCKYWYVGMTEFYAKYDEILDYYIRLNKVDQPGSKAAPYVQYVRLRDEVFCDKIPVISPLLRPAKRDGDNLKLDEINNIYMEIVKLSHVLNDNDIEIPLLFNSTFTMLQNQYFSLVEYVINILNGKKGLIRNSMCGSRINFSARNIITPAFVGRKIDEIVLPYKTMLELYKMEIINILVKVKGISYSEAADIHNLAKITFDPEIYDIMEGMAKSGDAVVLLNRNPTINYGSILCLTVCDVKKDIDDFTMSVNNLYTEMMGADYDGDVLNLISVKDETMKKVFKRTFSPERMIIDSKTGKFNTALDLKKDQVLGLNLLID